MSGYTEIDEAFPDTSGRIARKEERKRAKQCGGPALAFLKGGGEGQYDHIDIPLTANPDPDRQQYKRSFLPKAMGTDGFTTENLVGQHVNDVIGQTSFPKHLPSAAQLPDRKKDATGKPVKPYFGKGLDDNFADFSTSLQDNPGYTLTNNGSADFLGSFGAVGLANSQGKPFSATPSVNDAWKPLTPAGARSSFYEYLPPPAGEYPTSSSDLGAFNKDEKTALLKKLDTLFARLDDLETKRNENAHIEVSLFVLSGLFLIYGIDAVRRLP